MRKMTDDAFYNPQYQSDPSNIHRIDLIIFAYCHLEGRETLCF